MPDVVSKIFHVQLSPSLLEEGKSNAAIGNPNKATIELRIANIYNFEIEDIILSSGSVLIEQDLYINDTLNITGTIDTQYTLPEYNLFAGDDVNVICQNTINLNEASINYDLPVAWSQISGIPVNVENANSINPIIHLPDNYVSESPLVLRVQLQNKPSIYDEIEIFTRLTSKLQGGEKHVESTFERDSLLARDFRKYVNIPESPITLQSSFTFGDRTKHYVTWSGPLENANYVSKYKLLRNTTGNYLSQQDNIPKLNIKAEVEKYKHYKIETEFLIDGNKSYSQSTPIYINKDYLSFGVAADDYYNSGSYLISNSVVQNNLNFYTTIKSVGVIDNYNSGQYQNSSIINQQNLTFFAIRTNQLVEDNDAYDSGHYTVNNSSIQNSLSFYSGSISI